MTMENVRFHHIHSLTGSQITNECAIRLLKSHIRLDQGPAEEKRSLCT